MSLQPGPSRVPEFVAALRAEMPAVIVPVAAQDVTGAAAAVSKLKQALDSYPGGVQVIEWRVDAVAEVNSDNLAAIASALAQGELPILATVRTQQEGGGAFDASGDSYATICQQLLHLPIAAVDIEVQREQAMQLAAAAREAGVQVVASYHNWQCVPSTEQLKGLVTQMAAISADVYKIAVSPQQAADIEALQQFAGSARQETGAPVIAIGMGELGTATRRLRSGNAATFGVLGHATAPGQLSIAELHAERTQSQI